MQVHLLRVSSKESLRFICDSSRRGRYPVRKALGGGGAGAGGDGGAGGAGSGGDAGGCQAIVKLFGTMTMTMMLVMRSPSP